MNILTLVMNNEFDHTIAKAMNDFVTNTNGALSPFLKFMTSLSNYGIIFIVLGVLLLLFTRTRKAAFTALIAMLFGFFITNLLLKNVIGRPRPFADVTSDYYQWWVNAGSLKESKSSFPSGHATVSTAFSFALFLVLNKKTSWLYLLIPVFFGFTRIYFAVHYSTDVLAGFGVGILSATASYFTCKGLYKLSFIDRAMNLPSIVSLFRKKVNNKA